MNHALQIDPQAGRFEPVEGSGGFVSPLDLPRPSLVLDPSYPSEVLASRPWGYWRFESLEGGAVPDAVPGRPPLLVTGPLSLAGGPNDNRSVVFKSGEDCQYLAMKGLWEPTPDPGYAVELWFLPEAIDHASLVSMPAPQDTNNHRFFLEMGSRNRHTVHTPAAVRFLDRWPPGQEGGHNIYSTPHYVPYRWHHLVGQRNGNRMELFLDGEPTYSSSIDPARATVACQVLLGRLSTVTSKVREDYRLVFSRPFVGRLDEVALYDRPLSIEEIRRHHRLATQRVRDTGGP